MPLFQLEIFTESQAPCSRWLQPTMLCFCLTVSHTIFCCKGLLKTLLDVVNPLPHNDDFRCSGGKSLLKTLLERKKMLVTSIFFFSHNVFYPMKDNLNVLSNI